MRKALVWMPFVALVACDDGIFIEVKAPPGMHLDRVELIVGNRDCSIGRDGAQRSCNGVQPPGFTEHLGDVGDVFFRDDEARDYSAAAENGTASFQLEVGEGELQIIAIGTAGDTVTGAAVMVTVDLSKHPVRYVTELLPAEDLENHPSSRTGAGVKIWRRSDKIACAGVDDYESSRGPVFIVPESDPDCDEITQQPECDPLAHLTPGFAPDPSDPKCAAQFPATSDGGNACMLGGPGCSEMPVARSQCATTNVCVPSAMCSMCSGNSFDESCATMVFKSPATAHATCTFGVERDANNEFIACTNSEARAPLAIDPAIKRACLGPPLLAEIGRSGFAATVDIDQNGHVVTFGAENHSALCTFDITWSGQVDPTNVGVDAISELVLDLSFPEAQPIPAHEVLLPVRVQFIEDCMTLQNKCILDPLATDDPIFNCGS